ncbi:MAG: hypothetical protein U0796_11770 [Gemmatales bacterium]
MVRTVSARSLTLFVLCILSGCQSAERASLTPLAPEVIPTMGELMARGKSQINAAHEFYYSDRWKDLELASVALKETGSYLGKLPLPNATEAQRAKLVTLTKDFSDNADQLKAASAAQDPVKTNQIFQRLNEIYRQLRVEQMIVAPITGETTPPPPSK